MDGLWHTWFENWANRSHQELYDMVRTDAAGAGAVGPADQAWARFTALMEESVEDVRQALAAAGASWEGLAAESMQAGVEPLAVWVQDAGTAGAASGGSVRQIGESFAYAANAMPEPAKLPPDEFPMTFSDLFAGQIDQDRQDRAAQEAKQRAVDLMNGYSRDTDSAVTSVGTFVPPQSVTVRVPPPDNTIGQPIEHAGGSFEGPSGEPRRAGGPSAPLDAGSPRGGSPNPPPPPSPSPGPGPNGGPVAQDGGQTTTSGFADPVENASVGQPRGGPVDAPRMGGLAAHPVPGFDPITGRRLDPMTGRPVDVTTGRPVGGLGGRGSDDGNRAGRGALTGSGPAEAERAASGRGAGSAARAGLGGPAMGPLGAGMRREEDKEHRSPDYLLDYHDEFWDDSQEMTPAVLGEEDEVR